MRQPYGLPLQAFLATRTSRWRWLGGHVAVAVSGTLLLLAIGLGEGIAYAAALAEAGQIPRLIGVAFVYAPATCALVSLAVLGFGAAPRLAAAAAWLLVGVAVFVAIFGDIVDIPEWLRHVSSYVHTLMAPVDPVTATPLLVLVAIVAVLLAGGFVGLRVRDVGRA